MPKKDGFSDMKKDADKARVKLNAAKAKDAKAAKEAEAAREMELAEAAASAGSRADAKSGAKLSTNTTFSKAAAAAAEGAEEAEAAEDYDYDYDHEETSTSASAPSKAKKETEKDKKKAQKLSKKDEFALLAEQELLAKKERIKARFLRVLIVGVVMEFWNEWQGKGTNGNHGNEKKKEQNDKKSKKKASSGESDFSVRSIKDTIERLYGPFLVAVVVIAVLYGKACEDGYSPSFDSDVNFYDVMGLARDAGIMDVRKKYKSLALTWHPDKNPDCETCPAKFAQISKAYETLSDVDAKKAYDSKKTSSSSVASSLSVDLTAEDFEAKVTRSNEVWYVQVFDPNDGGTSSFAPIWEETANTYQHVARFGRIDVQKHKGALKHLPTRVVIMPVVFRFARGEATDDWMPGRGRDGEEQGNAALTRFVTDSYPVLQKMENADALASWWKSSYRSRLLISGNGGVIKRGAQNKEFFKVVKEAHLWAEYFEITAADGRDAVKALQPFDVELPGEVKKKGFPWSVTYIPAGETKAKAQVKYTDSLKELPDIIEEVVQKALSSEAPHLTVRNHRQLCAAGSASRTFCLFLVDMPDNKEVAKVMEQVATSRDEYSKELAEMKDSEDGAATEEPFRIQAVRVMTGTSRFPSQPVAVSREFYTAWAEVGHAPMFLVELETQRVAAVKASVLSSVYQGVAYEDLKFKELPEDYHLVRALPDPELPLMRVLFRGLSNPFGFIIALVLLAAVSAVAPELPLVTNMVAGGIALVVIILAWPLACRRLLGA